MKNAIEIEKLDKYFGEKKVLDSLNFTIKKGEVTCLIGPSGCGKTTLLRTLALLEEFDSGMIKYLDQTITVDSPDIYIKKVRSEIGIVFQDFNLWTHKTVIENITGPLMLIKKYSKSKSEKNARLLLEKVNLLEKENDYPDFLSGGQQQRAAIARTLALEPKIILLDEITSSLDPELVKGVLTLIRKLAQEGRTMVLVSHHMSLVNEIADNIIYLEKGKIIEKGNISTISQNPKIKRFLEAF